MLLKPTKFNILAPAAGALAVAGLYWLLPYWLVIQGGSLPFVLCLLLFCLLLHSYTAFTVLSLAAGALALLYIANESKIDLTGLPLTLMDIKLFLSNPNETRNVLKIGDGTILLILTPTLVPVVLVGMRVTQMLRSNTPYRFRALSIRAAALCAVATASIPIYGAYTKAVHNELGRLSADLWEPEAVTKFSRTLGLVGFIAHSFNLEQTAPSAPLPRGVTQSAGNINAIVAKYVRPNNPPLGRLPNIVIVHVESTFDPDYVFSLSHPVRSDLFAPTKYTQVLDPLYVNAIGGGSWISEFEVLTGVDSRFFGYMGYYTHSSVSPYVNSSFIHFLKRKGYRATAFYPVSGAFFNARKAFFKYGFDEFIEKGDLKPKAPGWSATDEEIIRAVVEKFEQSGDVPFLWFVALLENHSPHRCRNFFKEGDFSVQFASKATFEENCTLNEYVRILKSTSQGFKELVAFLENLEAKTGRPFVVLAYGDHQPHSFTGTGLATGNFSRFRRVLDPRYTYLHLMSSVPGVVQCCDGAAPHLTVIPTLLSGYVASSVDDLYLGANLYAYDQCGPDPFRSSGQGEVDILRGYMPGSDLARFRRQLGRSTDMGARQRSCSVRSVLLDAYTRSKVFAVGAMSAPR